MSTATVPLKTIDSSSYSATIGWLSAVETAPSARFWTQLIHVDSNYFRDKIKIGFYVLFQS